MKYFLRYTLLVPFFLIAIVAPLYAVVDGVPTSVVRSYLALKNGQSIRYEQDWEQLIAYLNEQKLQALLTDQDFESFLAPATLYQTPPSVRLTLLQWQFHKQLFNFDWMAAESTLLSVSTYAETIGDAPFQKWASSRISLLNWLRGNEEYAKAYRIMANEKSGSEEVWFGLFENALDGKDSPYSRFKGVLGASKLDEGLDFVALPTGEWLAAAALVQKRIAFAEGTKQGESAFKSINTLLPQAEMDNLAPYLAQLSEQYSWNLGSIVVPNNAALQASRSWVHSFKVKQTEWQIAESEQKMLLAKANKTGFVWPFSMPINIAIGLGIILIVVFGIRSRKRKTKPVGLEISDEFIESESPDSEKKMATSTSQINEEQAQVEKTDVSQEKAAELNKLETPRTTAPATTTKAEKTILKPTMSIVEAHQKAQHTQINNRYQASPKVLADTVLNSGTEKKKNEQAAANKAPAEKKEFDSKSTQKSFAEIAELKPKVEEKDLAELSARFIETLDEVKEQADFDQLWEMVDRFIDKEYPNWKNLINAADYNFSDKEFKYLSMMMVGIDNDRIADYAGIQKASLRGARSRIRKKVGIEGDAEPHTWILEKAKK